MARRKPSSQESAVGTLPENAVPLSEVKPDQRSAYLLECINDPDLFSAAVATDEFWSMIHQLPDELWSSDKLALWLYRRPDGGLMIKNPPGERKYRDVIRQPVNEEYISKKYGPGKWTLYLKMTKFNKEIREKTFQIDGIPWVGEGQVVEINGKPVPVGTAAEPVKTQEDSSAVAKVIDASAKANESAMKILEHASTTSIDMVKAQAEASATPQQSPISQLSELAAVIKALQPAPPPVPAPDPMQAKLMEKIIDLAFQKTEPVPEPETPIDKLSGAVENLTGKSLPDLLKPARNSPGDSEYGWVAPLATAVVNVFSGLPGVLQQMRAMKEEDFRRQLYVRGLVQNQPGQTLPPLPPPTADVAPPRPANPPATNVNEATPVDKNRVVLEIARQTCLGFDKHRDTGADVAATISVMFGELIEQHGLETALANPSEMMTLLQGVPEAAQLLLARANHAKWDEFQQDWIAYMQDRWGGDTPEESEAGEAAKPN